jgi:hypothetical protein
VLLRAADPLEPGHHHLIAGSENAEQGVELRAGRELARHLLDEHVLRSDAGRSERVDLTVGALVARRDPRIAVPRHGTSPQIDREPFSGH